MQLLSTRKVCDDSKSADGDVYVYLCTILIFLFTIAMEVTVHCTVDCCNTVNDDEDEEAFDTTPYGTATTVQEQPQPYTAPQVDVPQHSMKDASTQTEPPIRAECCLPNPSPNIRANRLITAVFLYAVVLTAFIIQMHGITHPPKPADCWYWNTPKPNWWFVVPLNILPFVAATLSLIRTVVDCWLVSKGKGLKYAGQKGGDDWRTWPPCMLPFLVFVLIREMFKWPINWLMGRSGALWTRLRYERDEMVEDIEMESEEVRRLVDDVDGDEEEEEEGLERADGPPAYDEAVQQQTQDCANVGKERQ